ncbi:MAG: signal peptidase I [Anaerolineales bacterium]
MIVLKRFSHIFASAFWIIAMILIWLLFAPTQAGGLASYIIVIGNSMEPRFHIGDLVIAHEETNYQVGDAVVYRNQELNNFVFHRIIGDERGKFTLQGDNNSWTDTYQPAREEIIGKLWIRIPRGGVYMQKLRNPLVMALVAGALAGFLVIGQLRGKVRGKKRMGKKSFQNQFSALKQKAQNWFIPSDKPENGGASNSSAGNMLEIWFFILGTLALISLIIGIISFSRPASRVVNDEIQFENIGFFSYSSPAPQGVYDSNTIKSGDPIFPKLTCSVDVNFQYTFIGQEAQNITGTYQLTATISETISGWRRIVPLQEETTFNGNAFGTSAKLNLCQIETLLQSMETGTDFRPGSYILTVSPNIKVIGDLSGHALDSTFAPQLTFAYDRVHFYLVQTDEQRNPLNPIMIGTISNSHSVPNTILLFGVELAIPLLRWFAVIGLVGALAGVTFLGVKLQELSKKDQSQFIRMRYNAMLVDIHQTMVVNKADIVDVTSIEDLAKLAEKFSGMILHAENSDSHAYYVRDGATTYRFVLPIETGSIIPENEAYI